MDVCPIPSDLKNPIDHVDPGCTVSRSLTRGKILTQIQHNGNHKPTITEIAHTMKNRLLKGVDFSSKPRRSVTPETDASLASHPAWKAFLAGMQMLQRYASRSPVSIRAVAVSNLRLLHRSLRVNRHYRNALENLLQESVADRLPISRHLHSDQGLNAELLALRNGATINLTAAPQSDAMYLLVAGNARLEPTDAETTTTKGSARRAWWQRIILGGDNNTLRNGDAIIRFVNQKPVRLTSLGKSCLLLRIRTPAVQPAYRIAS